MADNYTVQLVMNGGAWQLSLCARLPHPNAIALSNTSLRILAIHIAPAAQARMVHHRCRRLVARLLADAGKAKVIYRNMSVHDWHVPGPYTGHEIVSALDMVRHVVRGFSEVDAAATMHGLMSLQARSHPLHVRFFACLPAAARSVDSDRAADDVLARALRRRAGLGLHDATGWVFPCNDAAAERLIAWECEHELALP